MEKLILVRLRDSGQIHPYNSGNFNVKDGDCVIVDHDRGLDYGQIVSPKESLKVENVPKEQLKKVVRLASEADLKQIVENRAKAKEAFGTCVKKIDEHKLDMKLVHAEYSFDRSKIVFYFTAAGRIDFRNLVKDLAKIFKEITISNNQSFKSIHIAK